MKELTRVCIKCGLEKELKLFVKLTNANDSHTNTCIRCIEAELEINKGSQVKEKISEIQIEQAKQYIEQRTERERRKQIKKELRKEKQKNITKIEYRYKSCDTYNISIEDYEFMLEIQKNRCAICGSEPTKKRALAVDHDHKTGQVRGLLCNTCNLGLGQFKDSKDLLLKAIKYLN